MQSLTLEQGDAVLDLVQMCRKAAAAYEARELDKTRYTNAVKELMDVYGVAEALKVNENTLEFVLLRGLPSGMQIPNLAA